MLVINLSKFLDYFVFGLPVSGKLTSLNKRAVSLILAQNERYQPALHMQVDLKVFLLKGGRVSNIEIIYLMAGNKNLSLIGFKSAFEIRFAKP